MAHVRKDTFVAPPQWWKHLKQFKKLLAHKERQAAKKMIRNEVDNR